MTSREIIDGVITSINAEIARRKGVAKKNLEVALDRKNFDMERVFYAQLQTLERIEKDIIQVEINAKISYMGIDVKGGEE